MLTRRQLLGGLVACVPLIGATKVNKEDIAKVSAKYIPERTTVNIISIKKNKIVVAEYENDGKIDIAWNSGVKLELLSIFHTKDGTTDIEIYERAHHKLHYRVRVFNVNLSDFNIESCLTSSVDWSKINKENNSNYGQV